MFKSTLFRHAVWTGLLCFLPLSCSKDTPRTVSLSQTFPATSQVNITFNEQEIPGQCRVFSHLLVSIPPTMSESAIKNRVEQFAMESGADYILVGMTRESDEEVEDIYFRSYGPQTPYSFKSRWQGWKFGFHDWNNAGPLVDYGSNRLSGNQPAFDTEVTAQAVLLNCQLGPGKQ